MNYSSIHRYSAQLSYPSHCIAVGSQLNLLCTELDILLCIVSHCCSNWDYKIGSTTRTLVLQLLLHWSSCHEMFRAAWAVVFGNVAIGSVVSQMFERRTAQCADHVEIPFTTAMAGRRETVTSAMVASWRTTTAARGRALSCKATRTLWPGRISVLKHAGTSKRMHRVVRKRRRTAGRSRQQRRPLIATDNNGWSATSGSRRRSRGSCLLYTSDAADE